MIATLFWRVALLMALLLTPPVVGQAEDTASAANPIAVRRILVPADKPEQWPNGGQTYLPVAPDRLQDLLKPRERALPQVSLLTLRARYAEDGSLVGEGRLRVDSSVATFIPWPQTPIVLKEVRWASGQAAQLGRWVGPVVNANSDGGDDVYGLLSPGPGELLFEFRCPPARWVAARAQVRLEFPTALRRSFTLDLPEWVHLSADRFQVQRRSEKPQEPTRRQWRIDAPPGGVIGLALEDNRPVATPTIEPFAVTESTHLAIRPHETVVIGTFDLSSDNRLPSQVRVEVPDDTLIESALFVGVPATIVQSDRPQGEGAATVEVRLPGGRSQRSGQLVLRGLAMPPLDAEWPMPRLRLLDADWSEGVLTASIDPRVSLIDIPREQDALPILVDKAATLQHASTDPATQLAYRLADPNAQVVLRLGLAADRVEARIHRECVLDTDSQQTTITAEINPLRGVPPTEVVFTLQEGWRVESVETSPANLIDRWEVASKQGGRHLRLAINNELASSALQGGEIIIRTLRSTPAGAASRVSIHSLAAADPLGLVVHEDLMTLRAVEGRVLRTQGLPVARLLPPTPTRPTSDASAFADAGDEEAARLNLDELLANGAEQLQLDLAGMPSEQQQNALVRVARRRLAFSAGMELDLTQADSAISYQLTTRFGVDRRAPVVVYLSGPLPDGAQWLALASQQPLSAESIPPLPGSASQPGWRVEPPPGEALSGFRLVAELILEKTQQVPLPSLRAANPLRGRVTIGPRLAASCWLDPHGLRLAIPHEDAPPGSLAYSYDPRKVMQRTDQKAPSSLGLSLHHLPTDVESRPVALLQSLNSRYGPDGAAQHTARYRVALPGEDLPFQPPADAWFLIAEDADQNPITVDQTNPRQARLLTSRLSKGETFSVHFSTEGAPLQHRQEVYAALPQQPMPPAAFAWRIELPSGWSLQGQGLQDHDQLAGWYERVFGAFNATRWSALVNRGNTLHSPESTGVMESFELVGEAEPSAPIKIANTKRSQRIAIVGLFVALVAGAWLLRWPGRWWMATCLSLAGALVLPAGAALFFGAAWIGCLLAVPFRLVIQAMANRRGRPLAARRRYTERQTTAAGPTASLLLLMAWLGCPPLQAAQPPRFETLLVPVDENSQPMGDKLYVREGFLRELLVNEAQHQHNAPSEVVIRSLSIRGVLDRGPSGLLQVGEWSARFELTAFSRSARVWLPLRLGDARWPAEILVDGQPKPLQWNAGGNGCSFVINQPGEVRATLAFRPSVVISEGESCVQFSIPRLIDSQLTIDYPPDHRDLRAPFAAGPVARDSQAGQLTASLAARNEVLVCWTNDPPRPAVRPTPVSLLQWLSVSPQGILLEVQAQVEEAGDSLNELSFNPPLGAKRIEPESPSGEPTDEPTKESTTTRRVVFRLPRRTPVGVIHVPAVGVSGAEVRSRALALSVDDAYRWSLVDEDQPRLIEPEDFLDRWTPGPSDTSDIDRVMLVDDESTTKLAIKPAVQEETLVQRLELTVGKHHTDVRYRATNTAQAQRVSRLALKLSPSIRIESVTNPGEDPPQPLHWTRPQPDRLVVFPDQGDAGVGPVEVLGRASHHGGSLEAPLIGANASEAPLAVELRRTDSVLVDPRGDLWRMEADTRVDGPSLAVASTDWQPNDPPLNYYVDPNPAKVQVVSATWFDRSERGATAEWHAQVTAAEGEVYRVPLLVSPEVASWSVASPSDIKPVRATQTGGPGWWLELPRPLLPRESLTLRIEADLDAAAADSPPASPFRALGQPRSAQLTVVSRGQTQPAGRWALLNVQPAKAPAWLVEERTEAKLWKLYKPLGRGAAPVVTWEPSEGLPHETMRVLLADSRVSVSSGGAKRADTLLLVEPGGADSCLVRLPIGCRLLSVEVDGLPAPRRLLESDNAGSITWEVALRDARAASFLSLHTSGEATGSAQPLEVVSPEGEPIAPESALYEITTAPGASVLGAAGLKPLQPVQLYAARQHLQSLHQLGDHLTGSVEPRERSFTREEHTAAFIAEGPHQPPRLQLSWWGPVAARAAAATVVIAIGLAGATRSLWAKRLTVRSAANDS